MNTNEFKKILKPLIKNAVREVILEEGLLSNIVSEVARGLQDNLMTENKTRAPDDAIADLGERERLEQERQQRIKRLNESAAGGKSVFNNVAITPEADGSSPLAGVVSTDAGIDISGIQRLSKGKWKALAGGK